MIEIQGTARDFHHRQGSPFVDCLLLTLFLQHRLQCRPKCNDRPPRLSHDFPRRIRTADLTSDESDTFASFLSSGCVENKKIEWPPSCLFNSDVICFSSLSRCRSVSQRAKLFHGHMLLLLVSPFVRVCLASSSKR